MATPSLLPDYNVSLQSSRNEKSIERIIIPHNGKHTVIPIEELIYVEGEGNYSYLFTKSGNRYLVSKTLKFFEQSLSQNTFIRIHKSSIININYLKELSIEADRFVKLECGKEIAISRRKVREVYQALSYLL